MREIAEPGELRRVVLAARCAGKTVGFVPTMGALHAGHTRLMDEARPETDLVVASIFVNPTQFGPSEDFERYPRNLERDRRLASEHGVDVFFAPSVETMYSGVAHPAPPRPAPPRGHPAPGTRHPAPGIPQEVWVDPGGLATYLEGASRPGHFRGVATVVAKLFNLVQPDRAYFGQKDAQQAIVITAMVRDLAFPVEVRIIPTVREEDGLALSSRNVYLSAEERLQAGVLFRALSLARDRISAGERDARRIEEAMRELIAREGPLGRADYVSVADLRTLQPVEGEIERDVLISLAVFFGKTRLIDNVIARFNGSEIRFS